MKEGVKLIRTLALLTQLGLSVTLPLAGFVLAAVWLRARFDLGVWVLLVGILLGFLSALSSFVRLLKAVMRGLEQEDGEGGGNGNSHIHPS